jgi:hypothetical protein
VFITAIFCIYRGSNLPTIFGYLSLESVTQMGTVSINSHEEPASRTRKLSAHHQKIISSLC